MKCRLKYLPLFEADLEEAARYIAKNLKNPSAALRLLDDVEEAISKRSEIPTAFEPYRPFEQREQVYYRIYVNNYTNFYVVYDNVMELRRMLYSGRNMEPLIP